MFPMLNNERFDKNLCTHFIGNEKCDKKLLATTKNACRKHEV